MLRCDLVDQLIALLEEQAAGLEGLHKAMEGSRTAWLALRPTELQSAVDQLQKTANRTAKIEEQRQAVLQQIQETMGSRQPASVSRLSSQLPKPLGDRLRGVAGRATKAAEAVRKESGLGARLLDFSHQSQESVFRSIAREQESQAQSYDRSARRVVHRNGVGSFVDGRL